MKRLSFILLAMLLGSIAWGTTLKYTEVHDMPLLSYGFTEAD